MEQVDLLYNIYIVFKDLEAVLFKDKRNIEFNEVQKFRAFLFKLKQEGFYNENYWADNGFHRKAVDLLKLLVKEGVIIRQKIMKTVYLGQGKEEYVECNVSLYDQKFFQGFCLDENLEDYLKIFERKRNSELNKEAA